MGLTGTSRGTGSSKRVKDEDPFAFPEGPHPFSFVSEGGIPVFRPSMSEFVDFRKFIGQIEQYGMARGIVKVIPPKEWVDSLPKLDEHVKTIRIRNPIMQDVNGSAGLFKLHNIEKQRTYSLPEWRWTCEDLQHQPPARRGERRKGNAESKGKRVRKGDTTDLFEAFDYRYDADEFTSERCSDLERIYWKSVTYNAPMYGADMPGSLFDKSTKVWNVAQLDNILNNLKVRIPGVNTAYLYCGMWKATFAWHLEDMDLFSINYIHFGAPKQWYSISQKDHEKFYNMMADMWPEEYSNCKEFLRHKTFHASPSLLEQKGIKINKIVHYQHEFMITFPYGYHSGFNYGYNVAESVNFATESWIPYGRRSSKCQCISDSVGINVDQLVRRMKGYRFEHDYDLEVNDDEEDEEEEGQEEDEEDEEEEEEDDTMIGSLPTPPYGPGDSKPKRKSEEQPQEKPVKKRRRRSGDCCLCPWSFTNDFVYTTDGRRAHTICASYIPEITIGGDGVLTGLEKISEHRKNLKCVGCGSVRGICVQCGACGRSYHGACVDAAGVLSRRTRDGQPEFLCRFHRPKRRAIYQLEDDENCRSWWYTMLPGDVVQCQVRNGEIFAGVVEENHLSEDMVVISCLPECTERIEVEWKWIRNPFDGGTDRIQIANRENNMVETKKVAVSKTTLVRPSHGSTRKGKHVFVGGEKISFSGIKDPNLKTTVVVPERTHQGGAWIIEAMSAMFQVPQGPDRRWLKYVPQTSTNAIDSYERSDGPVTSAWVPPMRFGFS
jgi:hypothetical protein